MTLCTARGVVIVHRVGNVLQQVVVSSQRVYWDGATLFDFVAIHNGRILSTGVKHVIYDFQTDCLNSSLWIWHA